MEWRAVDGSGDVPQPPGLGGVTDEQQPRVLHGPPGRLVSGATLGAVSDHRDQVMGNRVQEAECALFGCQWIDHGAAQDSGQGVGGQLRGWAQRAMAPHPAAIWVARQRLREHIARIDQHG